MIYVLLTLGIMIASVLLVRVLCRKVGIRVKLSSLLLCAALSALVTGISIKASMVLDVYQYMRLAGLAILAALIVTGFNELLLRREDKKPAAWPSVPMPWEEPVPGTDAPKLKEGEAQEAREEGAPVEVPADGLRAETAEQELAETTAPAGSADLAPPKPQTDEAEGTADGADECVEPAGSAGSAEPAGQTQASEPAEMPHEPLVTPASAEAQEKIAAMETLDDLLSYAYAQKVDAPGDSIAAYRAAIERYPDDSYAPFLIIELAGLYKEHAAYQEAIRAYTKALTLPSVTTHENMQREFMKSLRYLGAVQDILAKHRVPATPFQDIPKELLDEIEAEFSQQGDHA